MGELNRVVLPDYIDVIEDYIPPVQSANALFHFMRDESYLLDKLRDKAIIPRYTLEDVSYLQIPDVKAMFYPMACFCDINLHRIETHCFNYGSYGIAFSKEWGIRKQIQPIKYINANSDCIRIFRAAFEEAMTWRKTNPLKDYLLESLRYMKPIQGRNICHDEENVRNFMDECEWRYLPQNIENSLLPAIVSRGNRSVKVDNEALEEDERFWLKFDYQDIRHIILPDKESSLRVMDFIDSLNMNVTDRKYLYTKIIIMQDFMEDV